MTENVKKKLPPPRRHIQPWNANDMVAIRAEKKAPIHGRAANRFGADSARPFPAMPSQNKFGEGEKKYV